MRTLFSENLIFFSSSDLAKTADSEICICVCLYFCNCVFLVFLCVLCVFVFVFEAYLCIFIFFILLLLTTPLLTSRRLPAKLTTARWQLAAHFISESFNPVERDFWAHFRILTQYFFLHKKEAMYDYFLISIVLLVYNAGVSMIGPYHCQPLICSKENLL